MKLPISYKLIEKNSSEIIKRLGTELNVNTDVTCESVITLFNERYPLQPNFTLVSQTLKNGGKTFVNSDIIDITSGLSLEVIVIDESIKKIPNQKQSLTK